MKPKFQLKNEKGSVTVLAVVLLVLLTILGIAAISTSSIETRIAGNELRYKQALYAAESASAYVAWHTDLYGPDNITPGTPHFFPNDTAADPLVTYEEITDVLPEAQSINGAHHQSFNGQVEYKSSSLPPRGSGYSVGIFKAHQYQMECNGYSSNNAAESLKIGFYRIGF